MNQWQLKLLKQSAKSRRAIEANLRGEHSPFSLSINGSKLGLHNWTHGIEEKSNKYLSPVNAVKAIEAKFGDYADSNRPTGEVDVVVLMVSSAEVEHFIEALEQVAVVLPDPVFMQARDYAKSSKTLNETKMIKTPQIAHPAFSAGGDITPQSARMLNGIMQNVQAGLAQSADPFAVIQQLKQRKAEREAENSQKLNQLLAAKAPVYAFVGRGLLDMLALEIKQQVPVPSFVFTACVCFVGNDLTQLKEMLDDD